MFESFEYDSDVTKQSKVLSNSPIDYCRLFITINNSA